MRTFVNIHSKYSGTDAGQVLMCLQVIAAPLHSLGVCLFAIVTLS